MEQKFQLKHPAGKKAVRMDIEKYDVLKKAVLNQLKKQGACTHTEILKAISADFKKNKTKFAGSLEWHMEWVKLDLEARNKIKRIGDETPVKFALAR